MARLKKTHRIRVIIIAVVSVSSFGVIWARLYNLQIVRHDYYLQMAKDQQNKTVTLNRHRGSFYDRNMQMLATSTFYDSVYYNPKMWRDEKRMGDIALRFAKIFKIDKDEFKNKLMGTDPVILREEVDPEQAAKVNEDLAKWKLPAGLLTMAPPEGNPSAAPEIRYDPARWRDNAKIERAIPRLARLLGTGEEFVREKLGKETITPLWRKVTPEISAAVHIIEKEEGIPEGIIYYLKESKRLYPQGDLAGPLLGFTSIDDTGDNIGAEGLEAQFDSIVKGKTVRQKVPVSVTRQGLAPLEDKTLRDTLGNSIVLTLDSELQLFTQRALRKRVGEVQAEAGVAIVMDTRTGGILALANSPDYDPNNFSTAVPNQRRNRAITDPIEIGSVMKMMTAAILIDNGQLTPNEIINCQGGRGYVDGRRFTDSHVLDSEPFTKVFAASSNIGLATVGLRLEPNFYYRSLKHFGVGDRTGVDLPGENSGLLRDVKLWTRLTRTSLPVGYETSLTAVQVATVLSTVANEGRRMQPHIVQRIIAADGKVVKEIEPRVVTQVVRPETCRTIIELMRGVIDTKEGTGELARVTGYSVAGKTGTTRKVMAGKHYIASFAGLIPATDPRLAIYIYVDEPKPELGFYGGKVSAPVFAEIAQHAMALFGIPPDKPEELRDAKRKQAAREITQRIESIDGEGEEMMVREAVQVAQIDAATSATQQAHDAKPVKGGKRATPTPTPTAQQIDERLAADALRDLPRPTPGAVVKGMMPECRGLTIREVLKLAGDAGVRVDLKGSGLAISQSPKAGDPIEPGKMGEVNFAMPSQKVKKDELNTDAAPPVGAEPAR